MRNENFNHPSIWDAHRHHTEALAEAKSERRLVKRTPLAWPRLKIEWQFSRPIIEFKIRIIRPAILS